MSITAIKQALKAFEKIHEGCGYVQEENFHKHAKELATLVRKDCIFAIKDLNQAIEDAKKNKWVGLTDEEIDLLEELYAPPIHPDFTNDASHCLELIRHVEAKLRSKNQ